MPLSPPLRLNNNRNITMSGGVVSSPPPPPLCFAVAGGGGSRQSSTSSTSSSYSAMSASPSSSTSSSSSSSSSDDVVMGLSSSSSSSCASYTPIGAEELPKYASRFATDVLVVDCRSRLLFAAGHLQHALSLTFSALLLRRMQKKSGGKPNLDDLVLHDKARFHRRHDPTCLVIVYDESCEDVAASAPASPLRVLLDVLRSEGVNVVYVSGGYSAIKEAAPELCVCDTAPMSMFDASRAGSAAAAAAAAAGAAATGMTAQQTEPFREIDVLNHAASQVLPHVLLGGERDANDVDMLRQRGITHVLNLTTAPCRQEAVDQFRCVQIPLQDNCNQEILSILPRAIEFIDDARKRRGCVLVHCVAGISRSPAVVVAYMMSQLKMTCQTALSTVKGARPIVSPNLNFMGQLLAWERSISPFRHTNGCGSGCGSASASASASGLSSASTSTSALAAAVAASASASSSSSSSSSSLTTPPIVAGGCQQRPRSPRYDLAPCAAK